MPHPLCTVHLECCTHVAESLYPLYISFQLYGMVFQKKKKTEKKKEKKKRVLPEYCMGMRIFATLTRPENTADAISEVLNSKIFPWGMPPDPLKERASAR